MRGRRYGLGAGVLGLLLAVIASTAMSQIGSAGSGSEPELVAGQVMELLRSGQVAAASRLFHFPASYDQEELERDREVVEKSLEALLGVFGQPVDFFIATNSVDRYEVGVFGGTIPYWESLPNRGFDAQYLFSVRCSIAGAGIASVALFLDSGKWKVRSVGLGMRKSDAQALEMVERARRRVLTAVQDGP